jgi:outer membrane immunogenic protein
MRSFGLAVAIVLLVAQSTLAADIASPPPPLASAPPPVTPSYSWSGLYSGVQLGGAWDDSSWRLFNQSGSGFLYGGQLGFNYQIGQFVLGGEGDLSGSTLKADSICAAVAGTNCQTQMNYLASVRARAGVAFDRLLLYADGGVAFGGFKFAQTAGLHQNWDDTTHVGWTAGTGVEYAFTDHVIGGLSYNYYEFPTVTLGGGINPATITSRQSVNTVLAKASYKV